MLKSVIILLSLVLLASGCTRATTESTPAPVQSAVPAASEPTPETVVDTTETFQGINSTGLAIKVPTGFTLNTFAKDLGNPRVIVFDSNNTALVSIPAQNKIVAIKADGSQKTLIDKLNAPHGLAILCETLCQLYVAETNGVTQFQYNPENVTLPIKSRILELPTGGRHTTRSLVIKKTELGNKLLISIGSACDVCIEKDKNRGTIMVADLDGRNARTFASGLRNSVFMTEQPGTNKIWATEMGRDFLGDELPPDEINIVEDGKNYGWPTCYGKNVHDENFDKKIDINNPCKEPTYTPSHIDLPAHSAPLGLAFTPVSWPQQHQNSLLVAFHGSWNRTQPTGYKIMKIALDESGNFKSREDFLTGWLGSDGKAIGRPAGIQFDSKSNLYITDDKLGTIYKLSQNN
ncbi:MAG: PQQ-dependent sugar dehydrogenase [bacterium]|nr:PQQ-dependent sugar dehydrogenase [bacterium]